MVDDETISSKIAKDVFEEMVKSGINPNTNCKELKNKDLPKFHPLLMR